MSGTILAVGRLFRPALLLTCAGQVVSSGIPVSGGFVGDLGERDVGLRVSFAIDRTATSTPDTATISVYNLAPERRDAMAALFSTVGRTTVSLALGYDGATSLAFLGTVRSMRKARHSGTDVVTEIVADDGGDDFTDAPVALSTAGLTAATLIEVAIAAMNTRPGRLPDEPPIVAHPSVAAAIASAVPSATVATFAAVAVGRASELLDEAARILGVRWWIRDFQIVMARRKIPTDGVAVAITSDMLLSEPDDDGSGLVRLEVMLDPNIVPGRQLALIPGATTPPTPGITGEPLRVEAVTQRGDTRSGPWAASVTARRIGA